MGAKSAVNKAQIGSPRLLTGPMTFCFYRVPQVLFRTAGGLLHARIHVLDAGVGQRREDRRLTNSLVLIKLIPSYASGYFGPYVPDTKARSSERL